MNCFVFSLCATHTGMHMWTPITGLSRLSDIFFLVVCHTHFELQIVDEQQNLYCRLLKQERNESLNRQRNTSLTIAFSILHYNNNNNNHHDASASEHQCDFSLYGLGHQQLQQHCAKFPEKTPSNVPRARERERRELEAQGGEQLGRSRYVSLFLR